MKKGRIAALLLIPALLLAGCSGTSAGGTIQIAEGETEFHISDITPASDFYGYVNAETLMGLELEPGKNYAGVTADMVKNTSEQLDGLIEEIVTSKKDYPGGSNEQLIREAYNLMIAFYNGDETKDKSDEAVISGLIERTNKISDMDELIEYWGELSSDYNVCIPFESAVTTDIYNTKRNILMVKTYLAASLEEVSSSPIKAGIERDNFKAVLCLSGMDEPVAREKATNMVLMYSAIAGKCEFEEEDEVDKDFTKNYVYFTKDEVSERLSNLSYERLCKMLGYEDRLPEELCIPEIDEFVAIEETFDNDHLEQWKDHTIVMILTDTTGYFPRKYNTKEIKANKADENAKKAIKNVMEDQISEIYVARYEDSRKVELATEICNDLKEEYYELIKQADWMSDEGKAYCRNKLDNMIFNIGSDNPKEVDEKQADLIGETIYQTYLNFCKKEKAEHKKTLFDTPVREGFSSMSPITINACYVPTLNCIVIPTAYMADENLDFSKSYEWNLGHLGSTIGHEISHGFDSQGIMFDGLGNYVPEAMPSEDRQAFEELQEKAVKYYSTFTFFGSHVNGKITLTENFADISGLQACLEIAETPDKQKEVLEAYAQSYADIYTDEWLKDQIATDEHSPNNIRVNAVVSIFDCFYEIYDVKEGDEMYVAPEDRIRRW
ncbi:MAG: M13 family metallopeptidase [Lachnospiraceae bacterium]|nr:M13 family metallopeptidase [Lachnospiraceae bacterium]